MRFMSPENKNQFPQNSVSNSVHFLFCLLVESLNMQPRLASNLGTNDLPASAAGALGVHYDMKIFWAHCFKRWLLADCRYLNKDHGILIAFFTHVLLES